MAKKPDFELFSAVALDIAGNEKSRGLQESLADVVKILLAKGYQIYLFSSKKNDDLSQENFSQPGLTFLWGDYPCWEALPPGHRALAADETLWVTGHRPLQRWLHENGLPIATVAKRSPSIGGAAALATLNDLTVLLDPAARTLEKMAAMLVAARKKGARSSLLVGIGGPPESAFQQLALSLKFALEALDVPLVNLLDLSSVLGPSGAPADGSGGGPWENSTAGSWIIRQVLEPLHQGRRVYFQTAPPDVPQGFEPHFPLFLSEETMVLILGQALFIPAITRLLDFSILVEVSPDETTRRVYEIDPEQPFDPKFTEQYLRREGGEYRAYLERNNVVEGVSIRVNAEHAGAWRLT
ncbi:MAG: hypothetical protein V3S29_04715 [bacterium]